MVIVSCEIRGTVSTRCTILSEKPLDGFSWSGERLTRKQTTSRPDKLWPEMWKQMFDDQSVKRSKSVLSRNRSSTTPEDCVVFTSLFLKTRNLRKSFKEIREFKEFKDFFRNSDASSNAL